MIRSHDFNARWWGAPVGIVEDLDAYTAATAEERRRALDAYAWTELRVSAGAAWNRAVAARDGFVVADVQVGFRIGLRRLPPPAPSVEALEVREAPSFNDAPLQHFASERYHIVGATEDQVRERFRAWAAALRRDNPAWCLELGTGEAPQGFYCSAPSEGGLHLALAGLYDGATTSGALMYSAALRAYAGRGARSGWAAFSVRNHAVHNIYASLGARFVSATEVWIRS